GEREREKERGSRSAGRGEERTEQVLLLLRKSSRALARLHSSTTTQGRREISQPSLPFSLFLCLYLSLIPALPCPLSYFPHSCPLSSFCHSFSRLHSLILS